MERIESIIDTLANAIHEHFEQGIQNVNCDEMSKAMDMLKDATMSQYYMTVNHAMAKSDNKQIADFRNYVPQRDMDRMYYTESDEISKAEKSRKEFLDSKKTYNTGSDVDRIKVRQHLDRWVDDMAEDVKSTVPHLTNEEKTILKAKMTNLINTI